VFKDGHFMCFESGRTSVSDHLWETRVFPAREEAEKALTGNVTDVCVGKKGGEQNRQIAKGCLNCPTRKYYANCFDFHFDKFDCPIKSCDRRKHKKEGAK
jgi:hypothetical protein